MLALSPAPVNPPLPLAPGTDPGHTVTMPSPLSAPAVVPLLVLLLSAVPAAGLPPEERYPGGLPATDPKDIPVIETLLRHGDWNTRIHAVNRLGEVSGPEALPGLRAALRDEDWQVRFTAVHWLGRLGREALPELHAALLGDPCRVIRLSAVHWIGSTGEDASQALDRILREMTGEGPRRADPDLCLSSPFSGSTKAPRPRSLPEEGPPPPRPEGLGERDGSSVFSSPMSGMGLASAPPPRREPETLPPATPAPATGAAETPYSTETSTSVRELDRFLALDTLLPEREPLEEGAGVPSRGTGPTASPSEDLPARTAPEWDVSTLSSGGDSVPETLPRPRGPAPRDSRRVSAPASIVKDAGAGRPEHDPLPALLSALSGKDRRERSRAADELGKRGSAARSAAGLLLAALDDPSARVRASAALALGNIRPPGKKAERALLRRLRDRDADVRYCAAHALARLGTPSSRSAFEDYLREEARRSIRAGDQK